MIDTKMRASFDPKFRDATIDIFADRIESIISSPKIETPQIGELYTCLDMLHAIVANCGNEALKLPRIRNWRGAVMARFGSVTGIPRDREEEFVDLFNRLEFAVQPESIHRLVYISDASREMAQEDLNDILARSHRNNRRINVTGLLLYGRVGAKNCFLQILEGRKEEVQTVYEVIRSDARHQNCAVCFVEDSEERRFPGWSMGYRRLEKDVIDSVAPGFSEFLENRNVEPDQIANGSDRLRRLLETFRQFN